MGHQRVAKQFQDVGQFAQLHNQRLFRCFVARHQQGGVAPVVVNKESSKVIKSYQKLSKVIKSYQKLSKVIKITKVIKVTSKKNKISRSVL